MVSVTWDAVIARRLERALACGVHAQVQVSAELQLGLRTGTTRAETRRALWEERTLAKAWTIRGTLHLHRAEELGLWQAAARAVAGPPAGLPEWRDPNGAVHPPVSQATAETLRAAVREALDDRCLTREELADAVGGEARVRLLSGFAFLIDGLVQGPPQGNRVTLARPDRWLPGWRAEDEHAALLEAARRFLHAHGPARPVDFRQWFACRDARRVFEQLDLEEVDVEGRRAFVVAGDTRFPEPAPSVRLLPEYDVYVMGFRERDVLVPERVRAQVAAHGRERYEGPAGVRFLLVDGRAAGLWERKTGAKRVEIAVAPVRRLTKAQRADVEAEVERIGAILGLEPVLTIA